MNFANLTGRYICLGIGVAGMILMLTNLSNVHNFDWSKNLGISGLFFMAFGTIFWFMIHGIKTSDKTKSEKIALN